MTFFCQVRIVKDINLSLTKYYPTEFSELTAFKTKVYFVLDSKLWVSDETFEGTKIFQEFDAVSNLRVSGRYLYFAAAEYTPECSYLSESEGPCEFFPKGVELWRIDGTVAGTKLVKGHLS